MAACGVRPARTSYVVVLADATGTARTLTIDATVCDPVVAAIGTPPDVTPLGLARETLVRLVRDSAP